MNLPEKNTSAADRWRLAEDLVEAALVDTVYRDLYLQRARDFLEPVLSEAKFVEFKQQEADASNLPNRIFVAMSRESWSEVKELSSRMSSLKRTLAENEKFRRLGEKIYQPGEPPLDPFSPGLQELAKSGDVQALLPKVSAQLERLQGADPRWQDFYAARRNAISAKKAYSSQEPEKAKVSGSRPEHKAFEALNAGDFATLMKMAAQLENEEQGGAQKAPGPSSLAAGKTADLTVQFPQEVLQRARSFGLAPMRMEDGARHLNLSPEGLASLYRYLWHPAFTDEINREGVDLHNKVVPFPADVPAAPRDLMEQFALQPFVNSGGARYAPTLVDEDVLVEDFEETDAGRGYPASALLSALGFGDRRGLSRVRLEKALIDRGSAIVGDLGLDVRKFRLICIPPDVYGRVGTQMGWGRQPFWTHFDGYLVRKNGKLGALVGGDVRFGGLYDLTGVSREYDSDQIIARFAVVQRKRMEAAQ